ncbi:hypothetical protein K4H02_27820, partial [Mycobacterium tuberculosis]|nr:hypothetical protein [Mycobacterium tuberculosis]
MGNHRHGGHGGRQSRSARRHATAEVPAGSVRTAVDTETETSEGDDLDGDDEGEKRSYLGW